MLRVLAPVALLAGLSACVSPYGWSEAPQPAGAYVADAPVPWWGRDAASVDLFFGPLSTHGTWGQHPRYGRVFLPGVDAGWQPYLRGHWRQDPRYGRTWVSAEPWAWATYHYGRWGRDSRLGWFWVPDTRFGPGWVDWRQSGGYASWSPLPPPGWGSWGTGWGNDWWVHAPSRYAWRPGYARPGYPGWNWRDRDGYRDRDRDRDDRWQNRRPPTAPVRVPEGAHPRSRPDALKPSPAWITGSRPEAPRAPVAAAPTPAPPPAAAAPARRESPMGNFVRQRVGAEGARQTPRGREVPARAADD